MEAYLRVLHTPLEVGVGDVHQQYLLLKVEHRADTGVQVVLHLTVYLPESDGTLVEGVLRDLLPVELEHLQQGGVPPEESHGLQLRERIDGTGDDLHQRQVHQLTAPPLGIQELPDLQHRESGPADGLRTDGAGLLLNEAAQADGHQIAPALTLPALCLGLQYGIVLLRILGLTVFQVEVHGHPVQSRIVADHSLMLLNHLRQHRGKLPAV